MFENHSGGLGFTYTSCVWQESRPLNSKDMAPPGRAQASQVAEWPGYCIYAGWHPLQMRTSMFSLGSGTRGLPAAAQNPESIVPKGHASCPQSNKTPYLSMATLGTVHWSQPMPTSNVLVQEILTSQVNWDFFLLISGARLQVKHFPCVCQFT